MLKKQLLYLFLFCATSSFAQTPYGNDWINFSQSYYKIKVVQKGIYRINYNQINQLIPNLSAVNPKNFQLFKNGKEQSIYVNGEADNTFDNNDFIEFYGESNDGTLDKKLYPIDGSQPHNYTSLFTDTASYFLTFTNSTPGLRMQNFKGSKTGLTSEAFINTESLSVFAEAYYPGKYIIAHMSLSDYQAGEGFLGAYYGKGQQQYRQLSTPLVYTGTGATPINLETYVAGRSDADSPHPQRLNHHLRISVYNGSSTYIKKDTLFKGYAISRFNIPLAPTELGTNTQIIYQSVDDLNLSPEATDLQAPAYAKISYPRLTDLTNTLNLNFSLTGNSQNRFLNFTNNNKNKPVVWDLTSNQRVVGSINGTSSEFVLSSNPNTRQFYLYDSTAYINTTIQKVEFQNLSPNNFDKNFIIITNKKLLSSAQNYADYRQQKGFKTLLITTEQLYDQFYYGVHHPLSIHNFAKYLIDKAQTKPSYLLLLGKGLENHLIRSSQGFNDDLVPTYGSPPSDDLLTARINTTSLAPGISTGRIGAINNEEVEIYLQKLKNYEQYTAGLWRKKFIHISGGSNLSENLNWANYQVNMFNTAKEAPFGADTINFTKNVTLPVATNQKQQIIKAINNGAAILAFLGHGAHQATEIDFGIPSELDNANSLLTYLVNGCTTGNTYIYEPSLGEKHLFYPLKGAVGWIGTSSEGVASYLSSFSTAFYQNAFNTNYGSTIAEALKYAKEQYQNPGDVINIMHTTQYTFQGDPALKFYTPDKPDYAIENQDLFMSPANTTALSSNFKIGIVAKNIGKAIDQPIKLKLTRTLPDNSTETYPILTSSRPVYNRDTVFFQINNNELNSAGMNKFSVSLDPDNEFDEVTKSNNSASFDFFFIANSVNIIYPKKYAIVNTTTPDLIAQSNNLLIKNVNYIFEIDTLKSFDSPWHKTYSINTGFMPKWQPTLISKNNQVYYWRVRLDTDPDKGGAWQESSFTYIQSSPDGWNQSHYQQFEQGIFSNLEFNKTNHKLEFAKTAFATMMQTRGDDAPTGDERTYRSNPGGRLGYLGYEFVGFTLIALKPTNMRSFNYPSNYNIVNNEGDGSPNYYSGQFAFNTNNTQDLDSLAAHLNRIPNGYYVMGFNGRDCNFSILPQNVKDAFARVGVAQIGNIQAGEPYMFWGQKGFNLGDAIEKTADYSLTEPARNQQIRFDKVYPYPLTQGNYITEKAGPATKWSNVEYSVDLKANDQVTYDLLGYKPDGTMEVLRTNLPGNYLDLTGFNANSYPKMAIKAIFKDGVDRTPAQMLKWKFIYDEVPEASINPEIANNFYKTPIQEGDSVKWNIAYQNLSKLPSDSVKIIYTLTKPDRSIITGNAGKIPELAAGNNQSINFKLPTVGLVGNNILKLDFLPINHNDSYNFNNFIQESFAVIKDNKEPSVDVAFDGKHIINGEIVSPRPRINIELRDENPYILLSDTSSINIYLKTENGTIKRIAYSSGLLNFIPASAVNNNKATVLFQPDKLDDGVYTLKVEAKDASGNRNASNDYTIDFEVVNEAAISNFYPYPNPFSTAMKFVFTLTGDKIPDHIKVQIMTVSGKVVREVFKEELGNLRIGNNISDFTWDGTDQYGDKLANGIYFYKVSVENNDQSTLKHRQTSGDKYFKKNIGKIYLMR